MLLVRKARGRHHTTSDQPYPCPHPRSWRASARGLAVEKGAMADSPRLTSSRRPILCRLQHHAAIHPEPTILKQHLPREPLQRARAVGPKAPSSRQASRSASTTTRTLAAFPSGQTRPWRARLQSAAAISPRRHAAAISQLPAPSSQLPPPQLPSPISHLPSCRRRRCAPAHVFWRRAGDAGAAGVPIQRVIPERGLRNVAAREDQPPSSPPRNVGGRNAQCRDEILT